MDILLSRHRNAIVLVAALFLQLILLAFQVKRDKDVPLIRIWAVAVIAPVEKASSSAIRGVVGVWRDYVDLRQARQENHRLIEEIGRLKLAQLHLREEAREANRVKELLQFGSQIPYTTVAARVIGSSASETSRVLFLDKGSEAGIRPNMAVITPDGVVGKVHRVFWGSTQVLVISDPDSGVGALLEKSRVHGAVRGSGGFFCQLTYIVNDEKVEMGDRVLTSGEDLIYPKGLPIGVVTAVQPGRVFQEIRVGPSARLNRLEEVLVIVQGAEREAELKPEASATATLPRQLGASGGAAAAPTDAAASETEAGPARIAPRRSLPGTDADKLLEAYRGAQVQKDEARKRASSPNQPQSPTTPAVAGEPSRTPQPAPTGVEVKPEPSVSDSSSQPAAIPTPEPPPDKLLRKPEPPPAQ